LYSLLSTDHASCSLPEYRQRKRAQPDEREGDAEGDHEEVQDIKAEAEKDAAHLTESEDGSLDGEDSSLKGMRDEDLDQQRGVDPFLFRGFIASNTTPKNYTYLNVRYCK
jgi:hypothetical protein